MKQVNEVEFYDIDGNRVYLNKLREGEYILKYGRTPENINSSILFDTKNIERILKNNIDLEGFPCLEVLEKTTQKVILKNKKKWKDSFIVREFKYFRGFVGV